MRISKHLAALVLISALTATASAYQAQSLAAHWTFSETSGTTFHDSSANGFDAAMQGGITLGHTGAYPSTGNCAHFDANQSPHAVVIDAEPLTSMVDDLTLAAWVRFETGGPSQGVWRIFGGNVSAWSGGIRPAGPRFTTPGIKDYDLSYSYPQDQWFHIAYVFDSAHDVTFYVDGVPVGTVAGTSPGNTSNGEWLIGSWNTAMEFWHGFLDDIQVYEGGCTDAEILWLFQNPGSTLFGGKGVPFCFGDGTGLLCPCGNTGLTDEGCSNSLGFGGTLHGSGSVSVTADDLSFVAENMISGKLALLFAGRNSLGGGSGLLFGDGLRCTGGGVVRLGMQVVGATGTASWGPGLGAAGGWGAGDTRYFQVWYQDTTSSPCAWSFNTTHAIELTFNQ